MKLQGEAIWKHSTLQCYRTESLRLGKTSKTIQSNLQLNTTMPAKPYHKVPCLFILWTLPSNSTTSLGTLLQCLTILSVKKSFPRSTLNFPWCHTRPFPLVLSLAAWEKRPTLNGTPYSHEAPQPGLSCCCLVPWEWKQVPYRIPEQFGLEILLSWSSKNRTELLQLVQAIAMSGGSYPGSAHKADGSLCLIPCGWAWLLPGTVTGVSLYCQHPCTQVMCTNLCICCSGCQYLRNTPEQKYFTCFTWSYSFSNRFTRTKTQQKKWKIWTVRGTVPLSYSNTLQKSETTSNIAWASSWMHYPIRLVILGQQYTFLLIIYSLLSLILMLIRQYTIRRRT